MSELTDVLVKINEEQTVKVAQLRQRRRELRQGLGVQLEVIESLLELASSLLKDRKYKRAEELLQITKALDANFSVLDEAATEIEQELQNEQG